MRFEGYHGLPGRKRARHMQHMPPLNVSCHEGNRTVRSVAVPVDLFVEDLGVERVGGAGGTGDHQQSNKRGRDGLHGYLSFGPSWEFVTANSLVRR